ncbi:hypothetical protein LJR143_003937 [Pseudoxanthomonas sp. LjRoot143]|uniref:hypothetical protein n=1 Tax=Pseudoxanthomonas sp. LjRoot143 TaxID=3342266 RepID=UPI003ECF4E12
MRHALLLLLAASLPAMGAPVHGAPVIDMHLHAFAMDEVPAGIPACPGDQQTLAPTLDPRDALDVAALLGSPFLLEELLRRHPRLRVYVVHYGSATSSTATPPAFSA